MRLQQRWNYFKKSPKLFYDITCRGRYDFQFDLMDIHIKNMTLGKRFNLLKTGANLVYRKLYPWGWPMHMQIEFTNYCNLKCTVCPTGTGILKRKPQAMSPALLKRLIDEVGPYLMTLSLWGWGESLLHPYLAEMLRIVHNRGITTFVSTNGQNLDNPDVIKALLDYPPTYLIVALDGLTDETNSLYRVGAKLAPALDGVHKIAEIKKQRGQNYPILHHRFIVMKHNEHEVPLLKQFGTDNEFDMVTLRTLSIIDIPDETHHQDLIPETQDLQAYEYENGKRINRRDFICEEAFIFPTVFADGTVVSCDQDSSAEHPYGILADGTTFKSIWWSKRAAEIRRIIRDNPHRFTSCRNCPFKDRPVTDCSVQRIDIRPYQA
ncbi:MAG: radical SAM protein [Dehalococcoidales bacterium]|nr:radical SAM protein [Dehalococcoidales bacterium]